MLHDPLLAVLTAGAAFGLLSGFMPGCWASAGCWAHDDQGMAGGGRIAGATD